MSKILARFWNLVEKTDTCWLWKGTSNKKGSGYFFVDSDEDH